MEGITFIVKIDDIEHEIKADSWIVNNNTIQLIKRLENGFITVAMFNKLGSIRRKIDGQDDFIKNMDAMFKSLC